MRASKNKGEGAKPKPIGKRMLYGRRDPARSTGSLSRWQSRSVRRAKQVHSVRQQKNVASNRDWKALQTKYYNLEACADHVREKNFRRRPPPLQWQEDRVEGIERAARQRNRATTVKTGRVEFKTKKKEAQDRAPETEIMENFGVHHGGSKV